MPLHPTSEFLYFINSYITNDSFYVTEWIHRKILLFDFNSSYADGYRVWEGSIPSNIPRCDWLRPANWVLKRTAAILACEQSLGEGDIYLVMLERKHQRSSDSEVIETVDVLKNFLGDITFRGQLEFLRSLVLMMNI